LPHALAVSADGTKVYAVVLHSGNRTTVLSSDSAAGEDADLNTARLSALGLNDVDCSSIPPPYPPLPAGITRNPALIDPPTGVPRVGLIVKWNPTLNKWVDDSGQDWTPCLPYRLPDDDLFVIDATSLSVSTVKHLGTTLFDVSVHPTNGKIYAPNTPALNFTRFEHPLGVKGHVVDNQMSIVDLGAGPSVTVLDLNTHINRSSTPPGNLAEREASISQPA